MKKATVKSVITLSLLILLSAGDAFSQLPLRFGLTFNPMLSWFRIDNTDIEGEGLRPGFQFGPTVDYNIDEDGRYSFSSGILITNEGGKYMVGDTLFTAKSTIKLQYIDVPLTVKLKANEFNYMTIFGQIGVTPGFNIRGRGDLEVNPDPQGLLSFENEKLDNVNLFNVSLTVGAGLEYAIAENTSLVGGVYFNNGFINVVDDDDGDNININNIALKVGVLF